MSVRAPHLDCSGQSQGPGSSGIRQRRRCADKGAVQKMQLPDANFCIPCHSSPCNGQTLKIARNSAMTR
eukprot:364557-Chlamydomonas_euryale.AAC.27